MSNVKLAVRVRPFTERELKSEKDRVPVVNVIDDNTITITNVKVNVSGAGDSRERVRRYYADYTFDSACSVMHLAYATQEKVFETIGREVVKSVSQGLSSCVLAYGQSATGKTHTMMGSEDQPGLIPRVCKTLSMNESINITVSFLEIYNERVHDLLAGEESLPTCNSLPRRKGNARKDLRVREHPSKGPYVQNLRRVEVHDVESLLRLVEEGARRRRTAATRRNSTSSRSHALLELTTPCATLHLADLAGSEKASWEDCGGGRQKEGANINKSLVALSNVISALVSGGGGRGRFVPYRDSALTWLLKDCFTGGACTFIIATVSPSVACYGESASTLRWAARARQLPIPRVTTYGSNNLSRVALQAQFNQLLAELARHHIQYVPETGKICYDDSHWLLQVNTNKLLDDLNTTANIGNIMNIPHPKTDAPSESTTSSVASGSSDVINTMDKNPNITIEINKEVDKLFGPALERTSSGGDLKVVAPLRHRRRQYRSQEVLPVDKIVNTASSSINLAVTQPESNQSQIHITENTDSLKSLQVPIFYDNNQRAEIVASVTERLYSKLKKKEVAISKAESVIDKKIMEPLSELRICTNARRRFIELSQKARRNKRRIGIPANTQTRISVIRVKDQGIDVQTDLGPYVVKETSEYKYVLRRDVGIETIPMVTRCKEVAVGPKYGSLYFCDQSTTTESNEVIHKSSFVMTDDLPKCDSHTQTAIVPPPRRKRRKSAYTKYIKEKDNKKNCTEECISTPVISINISQTYAVDSDSHSSDDNLENSENCYNVTSTIVTPDLLTNHNHDMKSSKEVEEVKHDNSALNMKWKTEEGEEIALPDCTLTSLQKQGNSIEDFLDSEDFALPRVTMAPSTKSNQEEIKEMILGRNANTYPYNIVLSPYKEKEDTKRTVKFKDVHTTPVTAMHLQTGWEWRDNKNEVDESISNSELLISEKNKNVSQDPYVNTYSDSTESSKAESDTFASSCSDRYNKMVNYFGRSYTPVYKSTSKYGTAKTRVYKDFLGFWKDDVNLNGVSSTDTTEIEDRDMIGIESQNQFRKRRQFLENDSKRGHIYNYRDYRDETFEYLETKILDSCNSLEMSVKKYDNYLANDRKVTTADGDLSIRTPTEYLQHLVNLRREMVKADSDTSDSSHRIFRK